MAPTTARPPNASALPADMPAATRAFLDYLQAECGLAVNTCQAYRRDLMLFGAALAEGGCKSLAEITPKRIEAFVRAMAAAERNPSSIGRAIAAVRMFCRFCVLESLLQADPSSAIEPPRKWARLPHALSHEGVAALLNAPTERDDAHWRRDRAILSLLYATGVRASELVSLKLSDVNFDLGVIRVLGKGNKERIVPAAEAALEALREYLLTSDRAADAEGPALRSRSGRPLRREDVFRLVRKYVRRAAIRGHVSPHTLRHCFATQMLAGGADLRSVQEMLGHADIATTQIYTHVDVSRLKAVHKKFHPRG